MATCCSSNTTAILWRRLDDWLTGLARFVWRITCDVATTVVNWIAPPREVLHRSWTPAARHEPMLPGVFQRRIYRERRFIFT